MISRNILLSLGILALLAGGLLAVLWFWQPAASSTPAVRQIPSQSILVAAQAIPAGTLLRSTDMTWIEVPAAEVTSGAIVRAKPSAETPASTVAEDELVGSVTRHALAAREPMTASALVRPGDSEFLGAALRPGYRAVSIGVDTVQSASGLVVPGDRVDIVLTQSFLRPGVDAGHQFVGETVLHDLRVIAVDQIMAPVVRPAVPATTIADPKMPKTITLEVTEHQAEMLLVAEQLGKIQITLLGLQERDGIPSAKAEAVAPAWASDVSPSLEAPPAKTPEPTHGPIEVIHGGRIERRCQTDAGLSTCP